MTETRIQITGILQMTILALDVIFIDESYPPVLLTRKAQALRKATGNWALHAEWEEKEVVIAELAVKYGLRPLQMLATPICLCITIYTSFLYALYYASLASFPIIFQSTRQWNAFTGSLPFLALLLGVAFGAVLNLFLGRRSGTRDAAAAAEAAAGAKEKNKNDGSHASPEARLPPMMIGSIALAGALFIIGWTSARQVHWIASVLGVVLMGFGYFAVFTSALNYLVDTFPRWGASALAANTFARSGLAAVLPLLIRPMFAALGNGWAYTVLGLFAVLMIPIPYAFHYFGARIRSRGKYSSNIGGG